MLTLTNKDKIIQCALSDVIRESKPTGNKTYSTYAPALPVVICNDKKDAEYIQKEVNTFLNKIIHNLVK